jgi:hypothetical protein
MHYGFCFRSPATWNVEDFPNVRQALHLPYSGLNTLGGGLEGINSEDGNYKVCRNGGKPTTFDAAGFLKQEAMH